MTVNQESAVVGETIADRETLVELENAADCEMDAACQLFRSPKKGNAVTRPRDRGEQI
jgi:hypothetical protein